MKTYARNIRNLRKLIAATLTSKLIFSCALLFTLGVVGIFYGNSTTKASSTVPVTGYATVLNTGQTIDFDIESGANATIDNFTRQMAGYAWSEDLGWVSFGGVDNPSGAVRASETGQLSSKAKVLNAGTIEFDESGANVTVENDTFNGYAWSEDLGWIDFSTVKAIGYDPDLTAPGNATDITLKRSAAGTNIAENGWINTNGYFEWQAAEDNEDGSGILGYCLYVGQDENGDPKTSKGLLGNSPINTDGACPYVVGDTFIDLLPEGVLESSLTTGAEPYYFKIKAIDYSKNVHTEAAASFRLRYDNVTPENPIYISVPAQFLSSKTVTILWPTTGEDRAKDDTSGVKGLQYKIGDGPWYGSEHSGNEDITDLLENNGSYTTVDPYDHEQLSEGNNTILFRTYDEAGNISDDVISGTIKINTDAPSAPRNLAVTPTSSNQNDFAFSWQAPSVFKGTAGALTYCYTVNVLPTVGNCTYTAPGATSLASGPYATRPGTNTFYLAARDEAGNINHEVAVSIEFTANTAAPGMPLNIDVADISIKTSSNWKLAVSWEKPASLGSGVSRYKVFRSVDNAHFTEVASTSGTSHVDSELLQQTYYYKVQACDSANNCGVMTNVVSKLPTGRFTEPALLTTSPSVTVKTRSAVITWATDRTSDSRIQFGTAAGTYFSAEAARSTQVTNHAIELNNLQPDTTYYFKARWTDEDGNTGSSSEMLFKTLPAPSIKDVSVIRTDLDSATVQLTSTQAARVKIYYGISDNFGGLKQINTSTAESSYTIELDGLSDGTSYFYKVNTVDSEGNEYDSGRLDGFTTPARPRISNLQFQPIEGEPTSTQRITWQTNVPSTSLIRYSTNGQPTKEVSSSDMTLDHSVTIEGLFDDSIYTVVAESRDALGNLASSDTQSFKTALDTRPPKLSNLRVEASIRGIGDQATGQLIVSWQTDEPATSQVAYSKGSSGDSYASTTAEDNALTTEHTVVISDLDTSQAYHLQAISRDKAQNTGETEDRSAIIGQPSDSVIDIIIGTLERIFGL